MTFQELLAAEFQPYGELSQRQLGLLQQHYELLLRWNQRLNLTRITALEDAVRLHYCESLFLALHLPPGPLRVADLGSGAGFPGIPAAVYRPDLKVTLIESDQRKAVFLREASRELPNVEVFAGRFEKFGGSLDWMISRAVALVEVRAGGLAPQSAILGSDSGPGTAGQIVTVPWGRERVLILGSA